ncbi:hypothetical protein JHS3_09480 [Jeongeupia sp. HS-3]|uniref:hypothetical protein n=1 Tax=Jeongeupia sp. HS-3 TaxID=1009682 RepID=UPI0018A4A258|nr:hypothetical protein [Jeongeupia sp. HS-3]BCL75212.1 hypothetical protein JHS3_09480 [Jeongeupia sp. HS-3]
MSETTAVGIGAVAMFLVWTWVAAQLAKRGMGRVVQLLVGGVVGILVLAAIVGALVPSRVPAGGVTPSTPAASAPQ